MKEVKPAKSYAVVCQDCYRKSQRCKNLCDSCKERKRNLAKETYQCAKGGIKDITKKGTELYRKKIEEGEPRSRKLFYQCLRDAKKQFKEQSVSSVDQ